MIGEQARYILFLLIIDSLVVEALIVNNFTNIQVKIVIV